MFNTPSDKIVEYKEIAQKLLVHKRRGSVLFDLKRG